VLDLAVVHAVEAYTAHRDLQRDRFIGMLAHDLRNPLTCVAVASELLLASQPLPRHRELLDQIADSTDRVRRMIGDVLGFARTHVGEGVPLSAREHDFGEIIRSVVGEVQTNYRDATIATELAGDLRGAFDRDR